MLSSVLYGCLEQRILEMCVWVFTNICQLVDITEAALVMTHSIGVRSYKNVKLQMYIT